VDLQTFAVCVFFLVILGIGRDLLMAYRGAEKWLRTRNGVDPEAPVTVGKMTTMLNGSSVQTSLEIRESVEKHMQGLMRESQTTNDLLRRFLIGLRVIAKSIHGIDLDI
jgi:hypothetical protein